jgi:hypothetical protein
LRLYRSTENSARQVQEIPIGLICLFHTVPSRFCPQRRSQFGTLSIAFDLDFILNLE